MRDLLLCVIFAGVALAQPHDMGRPAEKPVALYTGLGNWKHPIATRNAEAQRYFDQGLAQLYGFNRYEALRSFRKASELRQRRRGDAVLGHGDVDRALRQYGRGGRWRPGFEGGVRGGRVGIEDRGRAGSRAGVPGGGGDSVSGISSPMLTSPTSMKALTAAYPDDLDAATFYAESLMVPGALALVCGTTALRRRVLAEAERTLEQVLRRWPSHPGANHYYIHAVDSSATPERAIPSAQQLMGVVPWAGHMVHMPGHIWLALGDYEMAAAVNERAGAVDREYFAATGVMGAYNMYYAHNLHFIAYARSMQGRRAETVKAAKDLAEALAPLGDMMPEMADAFLSIPQLLLVRVRAWDEVMKLPGPAEKFVAQTALWRYARMMAMLSTGDRAKAAAERDAFEAARKKVPADRPWGNNSCGDLMAFVSGGRGGADGDGRGRALGEGGGLAGRASLRRAPGVVLPGPRIAGCGAVAGGKGGGGGKGLSRGAETIATECVVHLRSHGSYEGPEEDGRVGRAAEGVGCGLGES